MWDRIDGLRTLDLGTAGELRERLNELVLTGRKQATAGLLAADYRDESEEPECPGERLVLVGSDGCRVAEVEVNRVDVVPFREVTWAFAQAEGEGYRSLDHWREVHAAYWADVGQEIRDDTEIVCVYFRCVAG